MKGVLGRGELLDEIEGCFGLGLNGVMRIGPIGGNHFPMMEVGEPLTLKPIILLNRRTQSCDGDSSGHGVFE